MQVSPRLPAGRACLLCASACVNNRVLLNFTGAVRLLSEELRETWDRPFRAVL